MRELDWIGWDLIGWYGAVWGGMGRHGVVWGGMGKGGMEWGGVGAIGKGHVVWVQICVLQGYGGVV